MTAKLYQFPQRKQKPVAVDAGASAKPVEIEDEKLFDLVRKEGESPDAEIPVFVMRADLMAKVIEGLKFYAIQGFDHGIRARRLLTAIFQQHGKEKL